MFEVRPRSVLRLPIHRVALGVTVGLWVAFAGVGCAPMEDTTAVPPDRTGSDAPARIRETARAFLIGTDSEEPGFGLYSYLLFGSAPSPSSRNRYIAAIESYLDFTSPIGEVTDYYEPGELNINYLPITEPNEGEDPEQLLGQYNYVRARVILDAIENEGSQRDGPYIISLRSPLTEAQVVGEYLYQDLSTVPANLVRLWFKEFLEQVEQENFAQERALENFSLEFRTNLELVAVFAQTLPDGLLSSLIRWVSG